MNAWAVPSSSRTTLSWNLSRPASPRFPGGSRSSARAAAGINLLNIFPSVHTPDAAKQRAFREMGQSVKPLDSWSLASIELEKERRSADGQWWFVDEVAIFNKIGAETKENFVTKRDHHGHRRHGAFHDLELEFLFFFIYISAEAKENFV